ncbi:unnamed protein product, partial [Polarella glacialis]
LATRDHARRCLGSDNQTLPRSFLLRGGAESKDAGLPSLQRVSDPAYWKGLLPQLSIGRGPSDGVASSAQLDEQRLAQLRRDIADDGYFLVESAELEWSTDLQLLVRAVHDLEA